MLHHQSQSKSHFRRSCSCKKKRALLGVAFSTLSVSKLKNLRYFSFVLNQNFLTLIKFIEKYINIYNIQLVSLN
jgi:hypothetical protein